MVPVVVGKKDRMCASTENAAQISKIPPGRCPTHGWPQHLLGQKGKSMVWYGMVWYGMVWYGMVCCCCCCCCCCEGTQHVPVGEIARHALPGQGAREQSAGVTLAGRVPTTTEGGGGRRGVGGGGGRVEEGGATCGSHPGALPRLAGGELLVLCEAAVVGVEGGAVTLGWGRHARVHGHSAPCPNIPPRWPFLVCGRGVAGGAGPCF